MKKIISVVLLICIAFSGIAVFAEDEAVAAESIKVSVKSSIMKIGETQKLIVNITPANADNVSLEYISSSPDVVTAAIGTVIAKSEGTAKITVKIADTEIEDSVLITVGKSTSDFPSDDKGKILVSKITPQNKTLYIERCDTEKIRCSVYPSDASNKELIYESTNTSIATVDESGYIYGRRKGNTTVKIFSADGGAEASVRVYVSDGDEDDDYEYDARIKNIYITQDEKIVKDSLEIMERSSLHLSVKVSPKTANTDVKWRSSNKKIASVDESGNVTAHKAGKCTITATSTGNSSKKDSVTVVVTEYVKYPDSITVAPEENAVFQTENKVRFKADISPDDTTERDVIWRVSGGGTIDQNGVLTITDDGEITVSAYSKNYKVKGEYKFTAVYSPSHFTACGESYNVPKDRTFEIKFDADVNSLSAIKTLFVSVDEAGNGEREAIIIQPDGNTVKISPVLKWPAGDIYVFVKEGICDITGNKLGQNLKYKLNIRGGSDET